MKKRNLFWALAAGVIAFSACSKTESGIVPENDGAVQQIVLQVANGGDELTTRAGRPMYGSEAKQSIENVKLIICDNANKVVYVETIANWNTDDVSTPYAERGHGRERVVELTGKNKLTNGQAYKIYAIGYHNNSDYTNLQTSVIDVTTNGTFNENLKLTLKENVVGEEIFAGSLEFTPNATDVKGFRKYVVLNRQVSGAFGYVKEIPYFNGATHLKLVSSAKNTALVLGHFANAQIETNGGAKTVNYVVNGDTAANNQVLFDIDLTQWFTAIRPDANGLVDVSKDNWKNPYKDATFMTGSVFGGNFVIPFAKVSSNNTLELQLTDGGAKVFRKWIVKLPVNDGQVAQHDLYTWKTDNFVQNATSQDDVKVYNIVRNHLYGIGVRTLDKPTYPGPGPEPGPGPDIDEPESLNNRQDLILQVNDNWEVIHKMELE